MVQVGYGYKNGECVPINDPVDNTYMWLIVTQLLNGIASLLVSMTVFEFICAQAPRTTQGLLIGLWYATFSIRYLVVAILNSCIPERRAWLIYEGVKGFLILVSLILFSLIIQNTMCTVWAAGLFAWSSWFVSVYVCLHHKTGCLGSYRPIQYYLQSVIYCLLIKFNCEERSSLHLAIYSNKAISGVFYQQNGIRKKYYCS